ncbi:uncharacterized protein [Physcomitrium patens]|uniref:Uncharacterized protein n=1 Tax=Physcomitrium patens TaxID=3218 RepID=A0A2K1LB75_PHYPA|nr:uncharacterized protein LOC112283157 isoform X2 [Physcomitrium patens]PNR63267.1 hypothetical protein PHYPA_001692 [Physcomitrium patens]|eukprot:XP_024377308.1 uncharacterized protein LOC112283157 isoform X2 [Physcomitrella patens]
MLRLRAFRPTQDKVVKLLLHPTYPWLVTADASDNVVVWDWEHRQVVYEVNVKGVDERRLVGAQLQKLAEGEAEAKSKSGIEAIRGGSVKHVTFYDDDVRYWQASMARSAAGELSITAGQQYPASGGGHMTIKGRHFLVVCCENKVIFLDLVSMRARDVPRTTFDSKSPLCVAFLPRSGVVEGPIAAFGCSDGIIRVLSMTLWQLVRRYISGHKGPVACLLTFQASSGETMLISGGNDGTLSLWNVDGPQATKELTPKLSVKAHDGGVYALELARVRDGPPQLVSIGADKTLAIWDTQSFKELRRIKPVSKMSCQSVASWCHPRVPNLDLLVCVKDPHIWAIENSAYGATTRPLCDLTSQVPASMLQSGKKLKAYCMGVHPLQPHLVASGTNFGVILSEFDPRALPAAVSLITPPGSKEHSVAFAVEKEIRLLTFQLAAPTNPTVSNTGVLIELNGRPRNETPEAPPMQVKQSRKRVTSASHDSYSVLSTSYSGKYVSVVWPDASSYAVYRTTDWQLIDSGSARHFAWDTCKERFALIESSPVPRPPPPPKGGSSRRAKEAAAAAAQAQAAAAAAAAAATVQIRIIFDDGSVNLLTKSIEKRSEPVTGLQGGALLGVSYKMPRRTSTANLGLSAAATGPSGTFEDTGTTATKITEAPSNYQLYSWETFKPVSGMLPQPEWSVWDQTVEYCALAYQRYIVIASLRPQFQYLGNVAIGAATGGVWHRRQLFLATPTTIECVFVDAGVSALDLERKRKKAEEKAMRAQASVTNNELALLTVEGPKAVSIMDRLALRPPMLQVVRLASFQTAPSVPPFVSMAKIQKGDGEAPNPLKDLEGGRVNNEPVVAGGGVNVAVSRLPPEQKRPVGPLVVVGVKDGVLWLVDRYIIAHAIALSHPGIRCRCLAAYGDAVSAVKWAARLGREHHDDLAYFMVGMGYAKEALHLPGISKRLEFDLAMQSGDLKRALQTLIILSSSRSIGQDIDLSTEGIGVLSLTATQEAKAEAVFGVVKFAREFLDLIDAADATAQADIAGQALKRLAAAGAVEGALQSKELRGLSLRLAIHGEMTRLAVQVNTMLSAGQGREGALAAALLNDPNLMEKSWLDTGMFAEAALHAHSNGRPSFKTIMQQWNKVLQKQHGAGDVAKPKPLNLTPVSGADLLAPVEAPLPTPDKNSTVPGLVTPQQPTKEPIIEIVAPPSVLTSGLKVAAPPSKPNAGLLPGPGMPPGMVQNALPAPGMPPGLAQNASPAPGQQLAIEGPQPPAQPGQQLMIEGPPAAGAPTPYQVLGNELVPVTPATPVSFPGSQVSFEGQLLGVAPQPLQDPLPPLAFQSGLPPSSGGQLVQPPMNGFEALGMTSFVAKSQPVADFSDLDGFKALKPPTSGIGSQPIGDFFSSGVGSQPIGTGMRSSSSASALMDLSPSPPTSAVPPRAGTPPPANGSNELISLT